jgi:glycosyltransferase involved in cell wall biosynthesis
MPHNHTERKINLSLVIPVYNRPEEVNELLQSLSKQTFKDFEVIIVEDGSDKKCDKIVNEYKDFLSLSYFYKENTGPGLSRNFGSDKAKGTYIIFLDSDCVIPEKYIQTVQEYLEKDFVDSFGGPDKALETFSTLQKAINYGMTSFLTTGGIRGGEKSLEKFHPRSFNMGYSKEVYEKTKGFSKMRFGEDIDMSIRIIKNGFRTALIKDAYVFHKRRSNLRQFFKQVHNSGIARINLFKKHPESLKIVHFFPSLFTLSLPLFILLSLIFSPLFITPLALYCFLLFTDSTYKNKSISVGFLSVFASFCQLTGYGTGFILAFWKRIIFSKNEFSAFDENFYD